MKFSIEFDRNDGLVLIDQSYLVELNDELLYSMDFLLDPNGETELVYDFSENWNIVWERESKLIKNYANSGKMLVFLLQNEETFFDLNVVEEISDYSSWLSISTGNLLAVSASELIQCLLYPELDMVKIFELKLQKGGYAISINNNKEITYCLRESPNVLFENVIMDFFK